MKDCPIKIIETEFKNDRWLTLNKYIHKENKNINHGYYDCIVAFHKRQRTNKLQLLNNLLMFKCNRNAPIEIYDVIRNPTIEEYYIFQEATLREGYKFNKKTQEFIKTK